MLMKQNDPTNMRRNTCANGKGAEYEENHFAFKSSYFYEWALLIEDMNHSHTCTKLWSEAIAS